MPSSLLEIVELSNGEFVLRRVSEDAEPLVNIRFSGESKEYIDGIGLEVARIMIQAGIQAVAFINEEKSESDENVSQPKNVLH